MIDRSKYYSQTEVIKKFKISREKYHQLIIDNNIAFETVLIDYKTYQINTIYILKETIDKMNLQLR